MPAFRKVRGMRDFLPREAEMMRYIEDKARRVAQLYGYGEMITPVLESYKLLAAKAGEEIRSRMYAFTDLGGRRVALRPEFTASIARLVATTLRNQPKPLRMFSVGSLYRYDEPQQGRYREFWQSNYELMGSREPQADAEILMLTESLMKTTGLRNSVFKVGHVGILKGILCEEEVEDAVQNHAMQLMDKKQWDDALRLVKDARVSDKCLTTLRNLVKIKGNRSSEVLNKVESQVEDYSSAVNAVRNLQGILELVSESEEKIDLTLEAGFARGLEYYTGMVFEVYVPQFASALGGGGRYDKLIELFGGEPTPAVGVAHGIDRIMLAMQKQKISLEEKREKKAIVVPTKASLNGKALKVSQMLRDAGVLVEVEVMGRKVARALEDADRRHVDYVIIIGERELREGAVVIRDLERREQETVKIEDIVRTMRG